MNIHPLWFICILVRFSLILFINKFNEKYSKICILILTLIGTGFIYKAYFGSNNEFQLAKVFWHETRYIHGLLYIMATLYLYKKNINLCSILLFIDILFSISYRLYNSL